MIIKIKNLEMDINNVKPMMKKSFERSGHRRRDTADTGSGHSYGCALCLFSFKTGE
jgi:hypothetical protein